MGRVFRAHDTKLNRPVAIKILSDEIADHSGRVRFQREAQTASSLNHPHIVTVHDAGAIDGQDYIVTEFVDGGPLSDWIKAEPRSWRQIVQLLIGVGDGLATAHAAGILHRDVKPGNILVATNGYAKLADFGLARRHESPEASTITSTPTVPATSRGAIVGTVAYMSPEQAMGRALDQRTDIFSFGVVLYELLAGERPFSARSDVEVLSAIVRDTPKQLPAAIPVALRLAVEKALEKDPAAGGGGPAGLVARRLGHRLHGASGRHHRPALAGPSRWDAGRTAADSGAREWRALPLHPRSAADCLHPGLANGPGTFLALRPCDRADASAVERGHDLDTDVRRDP